MPTMQEIHSNRSRVEQILGAVMLLFVLYFLIGFASLGQVAEGANDINYVPFFHAPWKWMLQFFHFIGLI